MIRHKCIVGFTFSEKPTVEAHVENLVRKANKRYYAMIRHKKAGLPQDKLLCLYNSVIRSVLEFASVVYHSLLTKKMANLLENVQKRALRLIYGYNIPYSELLEISTQPALEERRITSIDRFIKSALKNPKYGPRWFPQRSDTRLTRNPIVYLEEQATGNRLYNSPLFSMRRKLNGREIESVTDLTGIFCDPFN